MLQMERLIRTQSTYYVRIFLPSSEVLGDLFEKLKLKHNTNNWGRQNTQSLQAVLAVAPLKKGKHCYTRKCVRFLSVCLSSTICVYRTAKWFKAFVRGTFETEKLRKLSGPDPAELTFYH